MTTAASQNIVSDYTRTNEYLQNLTIAVGDAQVEQKPSLADAAAIVNDFITYNDITTDVLEKFQENYRQFEKNGKVFTTEYAFTNAVLECSDIGVLPLDAHMATFVSTSAHAVSGDVTFLHGILGHIRGNTLEKQGIPQITVSSTNDDYSEYKKTLNCISAIYSLEKVGVIRTASFIDTVVGLSSITTQKNGDAHGNMLAAERILTDSIFTMNTVNNAWIVGRNMLGFLSAFCTDNRIKAINKNPHDPNDVKFWDMLKHAVDYGTMDVLPLMQRDIDHHDQPDALLAFSLLKMWDVLNQTAFDAVRFLRLGMRDYTNEHSRLLHRGVSLKSMHVSPVLRDGQALVVVEDMDSKFLRTGLVNIEVVTSMYPELCGYVTKKEFYAGSVSDSDWEPFMVDVKSINAQLMNDWSNGIRHEVASEFTQLTDVKLCTVSHVDRKRGFKAEW